MLNISEIFAEISQFLADGETPPTQFLREAAK